MLDEEHKDGYFQRSHCFDVFPGLFGGFGVGIIEFVVSE